MQATPLILYSIRCERLLRASRKYCDAFRQRAFRSACTTHTFEPAHPLKIYRLHFIIINCIIHMCVCGEGLMYHIWVLCCAVLCVTTITCSFLFFRNEECLDLEYGSDVNVGKKTVYSQSSSCLCVYFAYPKFSSIFFSFLVIYVLLVDVLVNC